MRLKKLFSPAFLFLILSIFSTVNALAAKLSQTAQDATSIQKESWKQTETEHFIVHFLNAKDAETVVIYSEHDYEWIKNFFGIKNDQTKEKSHIFVFSDEALWKQFLAKTRQFSFEAGGFTNGQELFMYRPSYWLSPQQVLAHEMSHLILFRFLDAVPPLYLNEGFAEYVSLRTISTQFGGDEYLIHTVKLLPKDKYVPLNQFTQITAYPTANVDEFYRQSELLVRYLVMEHGNAKMFEFLKLTAKGTAFSKALQSVYGVDQKSFEAKFMAYAVAQK